MFRSSPEASEKVLSSCKAPCKQLDELLRNRTVSSAYCDILISLLSDTLIPASLSDSDVLVDAAMITVIWEVVFWEY